MFYIYSTYYAIFSSNTVFFLCTTVHVPYIVGFVKTERGLKIPLKSFWMYSMSLILLNCIFEVTICVTLYLRGDTVPLVWRSIFKVTLHITIKCDTVSLVWRNVFKMTLYCTFKMTLYLQDDTVPSRWHYNFSLSLYLQVGTITSVWHCILKVRL